MIHSPRWPFTKRSAVPVDVGREAVTVSDIFPQEGAAHGQKKVFIVRVVGIGGVGGGIARIKRALQILDV